MAVTDLLAEGLRLMVIGMGIVFAFLLLLVGALRVMSAAAMRIAPEDEPPGTVASPAATVPDAESSTELIAVIGAAVARYRHGRQADRGQG